MRRRKIAAGRHYLYVKYDVPLKDLFDPPPQKLFVHCVGVEAGPLAPMELPVTQLRPDLMGETADGRPLHCELQLLPEDDLAGRMLGYRWANRRRTRKPDLLQILFLLNGPASSVRNSIEEEGLSFRFHVVALQEVDATVLDGGTTAESVLSVLCRGGATPARVKQVLRRCAELPAERCKRMLQFLELISGLRPGLGTIVKEEIERVPLTIDVSNNVFWLEAFAKGEEKGRQEGQDAARRWLARLLTARFGPLPQAIEERLGLATEAEMERLADRVLTAPSLDAVFESEPA